MGTSPDELEAQIEQTREELAATVDEIGHKVADLRESVRPANVVRRPRVQQALAGAAGAFGVVALLKLWRRRRRARRG